MPFSQGEEFRKPALAWVEGMEQKVVNMADHNDWLDCIATYITIIAYATKQATIRTLWRTV